MVTPQEFILNSETVSKRIKTSADKKRAINLIKKLQADFSKSTISSVIKFLNNTFAKMYEGINLDFPDKNFDLIKLAEKNTVVLVPNHQSHADYVALSYAIYSRYNIPIFIAGGDNLNIFPIGDIFRKCGCFFIRRSFANDILYKVILESYISYLLLQGEMIEFFFEGGRSRTGKLQAPRFGIFQMLIDGYGKLYENKEVQSKYNLKLKPMVFVPVSISHEYIPEASAHSKELKGGSKKKESTSQLLKLFKLKGQNFGTIHLKFAQPVKIQPARTLRERTHSTAFKCYLSVGKNMMVTPSSIIAMILLDDPFGTLTFEKVSIKTRQILEFCNDFEIPYATSLKGRNYEKSIKSTLDNFVDSKKINIINAEKLDKKFYVINDEYRHDLLYFKNSIIHHFLVPCFINSVLLRVLNGEIKSVFSLKKYLLLQRKEFKYEFYLPPVLEMVELGFKIISKITNKDINNFEQCLNLSSRDLDLIGKDLNVFSMAFVYIYEAYYVTLMALKHLSDESFSLENVIQCSKEIFDLEKEHGRLIKFPESYSVSSIKNAVNYFVDRKIVSRSRKEYKVKNKNQLNSLIEKLANDLTNTTTYNVKLNG